MSLVLNVDGPVWREHLQSFAAAHPGLVPVLKGNGYGFGLGRLARKSAWLGVDTIAVGIHEELGEVANRFDGSLLVLTPWRPFGAALELAPGSP
ncbi:alanine racemase [Nocardioides zeae]